MILINFSHPLTKSQRREIESLTDQEIANTLGELAHFDHDQPFADQVRALVDELGLSPEEWQTLPFVVIPPAFNFAAVTLLAELHGRMGYFPAVIRIRPVPQTTPTRYEVAEIINLQNVREQARITR
jgi:hypothetical protein